MDATVEDGSLGRLVNDSETPNVKIKKLVIGGVPHLCLFALKDITRNEEITFDYGGDNLPWRTIHSQVRLYVQYIQVKLCIMISV